MRRIVLLFHPQDQPHAAAIGAQLLRQLDRKAYTLWTPSDYTASANAPEQLHNAIEGAWAVLVMIGANGTDQSFDNVSKPAIQTRKWQDGTSFGTIRIDLADCGPIPPILLPWPSITAAPAPDHAQIAGTIIRMLGLEANWSRKLAVDRALETLAADMRRPFTEIAAQLAAGRPITLLVGPYAPVEDGNDGSCPSQVRARLRALIADDLLRAQLGGDATAASPVIWQDHLATLCLLSDDKNIVDAVSDAMEDVIRTAPGDETGPPTAFHMALAELAEGLRDFRQGAVAESAQPALTLISFCPGLRAERALIARGLSFERAALQLGPDGRVRLRRDLFTPEPSHIAAARSQTGSVFLPDDQPIESSDRCEAIRLIKLAGSRDLDDSVPSHLAQTYLTLCAFVPSFESLVSAVAMGPNIALGGGLATPPLQSAHAVLLRPQLDRGSKRPRLALVPSVTQSPDLLRRAEAHHVEQLARVPGSGFNRIDLVHESPLSFIRALSVALRSAEAA